MEFILQILAVAIGGAFGSVARFLLFLLVQRFFIVNFPFGILFINIIGSFMMGLLSILLFQRFAFNHNQLIPLAILVGVLGGFTTFSSFSLDAVNLWLNSARFSAILYVFISIVSCLASTLGGILLARNV